MLVGSLTTWDVSVTIDVDWRTAEHTCQPTSITMPPPIAEFVYSANPTIVGIYGGEGAREKLLARLLILKEKSMKKHHGRMSYLIGNKTILAINHAVNAACIYFVEGTQTVLTLGTTDTNDSATTQAEGVPMSAVFNEALEKTEMETLIIPTVRERNGALNKSINETEPKLAGVTKLHCVLWENEYNSMCPDFFSRTQLVHTNNHWYVIEHPARKRIRSYVLEQISRFQLVGISVMGSGANWQFIDCNKMDSAAKNVWDGLRANNTTLHDYKITSATDMDAAINRYTDSKLQGVLTHRIRGAIEVAMMRSPEVNVLVEGPYSCWAKLYPQAQRQHKDTCLDYLANKQHYGYDHDKKIVDIDNEMYVRAVEYPQAQYMLLHCKTGAETGTLYHVEEASADVRAQCMMADKHDSANVLRSYGARSYGETST